MNRPGYEEPHERQVYTNGAKWLNCPVCGKVLWEGITPQGTYLCRRCDQVYEFDEYGNLVEYHQLKVRRLQ